MAKRINSIRPREQACCGGSFITNEIIFGSATPGGCVDTDVDIVTNGDFAIEVFQDGLPVSVPNVWQWESQGIVPPAAFGWNADRMFVTASSGGAGSAILSFSGFDGVTYDPNIDSSVDQTFSVDITLAAAMIGKFIYLTLVDYTNGKYIQVDLSAEPYGTYTNTFVPGDWTVGAAPNEGVYWKSNTAISLFFVFEPGLDDDYTIDNVSLTHVECI